MFISCCDLPCFIRAICGSVHFHCNSLYLVARRGRLYVVEDNQCGWGPGSDNWEDMAGCWILIFTNIHRTAFPALVSKVWWWWQWPTQDVWHGFLQCHHWPFVQLSGFFCNAQRKGDHIEPRGSRRVSLLCLLCSGPLGGDQLIPSIIIGLPSPHYSLSPLLSQRLLHTLWIVVDADNRKTRSRFSSFRGKEDKSLGKGEETVVATPGLEFHGISRHKFDEPQSNKSTLLF